MRYAKSLSKVIYTGSRNLIDTSLRKRLQPAGVAKSAHNEYPILMMHGFMGFSEMKIFNITLFEYFNGVKMLLEQMGYTVYTPSVTPISPPQDRAQEWADYVNEILAETSAEKVHLIAHSQGCIDARVLAAPAENSCTTGHFGDLHGIGFGDKIATITTLGGPHEGTPLADDMEGTDGEKFMIDMIEFIAMITGSNKKAAKQAIESMSRTYMLESFNKQIHVPKTIPCYTVAGNPGHAKNVSFMFDKTWAELMKMDPTEGGGANDGFVPVASALFSSNKVKMANGEPQWQALGEVVADHVALVGIPIEGKADEDFKHLPMFAGLAQNVDACYRENIALALQPDGEWSRACSLIPKQKSAKKSKATA
ncbi:MAG: hypothetical protein HRU20_05055 [Pseudomonadales bacterium]|nr:hypothetical protein [Pseudomonadales bacterium]